MGAQGVNDGSAHLSDAAPRSSSRADGWRGTTRPGRIGRFPSLDRRERLDSQTRRRATSERHEGADRVGRRRVREPWRGAGDLHLRRTVMKDDVIPPAPGSAGEMDDRVKTFTRWRSLGWVARFALAAQVSCACAPPALAQPQTRRAEAGISFDGAASDATRRRATVESASREAQEAIRACDDRTALICVADALTRYAAALHQIAEERRRRIHASSYRTP